MSSLRSRPSDEKLQTGCLLRSVLGLGLLEEKGREMSRSGQLEKSSWDRVSVDIKHGTGKVPSLSWT